MQNAKDLLIALANARIVVQPGDFCTAHEGGRGPTVTLRTGETKYFWYGLEYPELPKDA